MRSKLGRELGGFSPLAVFGVLVIVVAALGAAVLLFQPDADPADPAPRPEGSQPGAASEREDDLRLTNAEAIARFNELDNRRLALFSEPRRDLAGEVFAPGSPALRRVFRSLSRLKSENAYLEHVHYRTETLRVLASSPDKIRLRQRVVVRTRVRSEAGEDLTIDARPKRQVVIWVLRRQGREWLIFDGKVVTARFLED